MKHRMEELLPKKLVGKKMEMSLANNKTGELWQSFMKERQSIENPVNTSLYSLQVYKDDYFKKFDPARNFTKYALAEVNSFDDIPEKMVPFELTGGLYAVFNYKGHPKDGASAFRYIMGEWLPNSGYVIDCRPHFELLGEKYNNDSSDSEEEIWIPVESINRTGV